MNGTVLEWLRPLKGNIILIMFARFFRLWSSWVFCFKWPFQGWNTWPPFGLSKGHEWKKLEVCFFLQIVNFPPTKTNFPHVWQISLLKLVGPNFNHVWCFFLRFFWGLYPRARLMLCFLTQKALRNWRSDPAPGSRDIFGNCIPKIGEMIHLDEHIFQVGGSTTN